MAAAIVSLEQKQELIDSLQASLALAERHLELERACAWRDFLAYYALLSGMAAAGDANVEQAIAPIVEFMAYGPQPKKAEAKNQDVEPVAAVTAVKESNG